MKTLRPLGFFRELRHGSDDGPSLRACVSDTAQEDEDKVGEYLQQGAVLVSSFGVAEDVLDSSVGLVCSPDILTDGIWAWPADLAYYVRKYHVSLPGEFIAHVRQNEWRVPEQPEIDLSELTL
jgi:hypothetical protein